MSEEHSSVADTGNAEEEESSLIGLAEDGTEHRISMEEAKQIVLELQEQITKEVMEIRARKGVFAMGSPRLEALVDTFLPPGSQERMYFEIKAAALTLEAAKAKTKELREKALRV